MANFVVTLEAGWLVRDVRTVNDAMNVAISEIGKALNPDLSYVEIEVGTTQCPACGEMLDSVFLAANTALVGVSLQMRVFDAENSEHAARIAKAVIGRALRNTPLKIVEVRELK